MKYLSEIQSVSNDPQALENLYQNAQRENEVQAFQSAMLSYYEEMPDNVLYAAWYYRLQQSPAEARPESERRVNWGLAIPIGILTGLIFWLLSDFDLEFVDYIPHLIFWWSPIATLGALIFLAIASRKRYQRTIILGAALIFAAVYVMLLAPGQERAMQHHYVDLMVIHLPLLSWIAIGLFVLGLKSAAKDRFSFLIKSVEVMITAGLYLMAGMAFAGITFGMFGALSVDIPEVLMRLIFAGGFGLLPVLAVATIYDPRLQPGEQDFEQGLSKFIHTMMRLLLPLTLLVLVIYIFVIPFNFMEPFENRDVLIVYNVMLFAVMGLLFGATPIRPAELSPRLQTALRNGIIAVAILAALVSVYALSATVYRTQWGITINRLTIIGWNTINIGILVALIVKQFRDGREKWIESLQLVFSIGTNAYVVWCAFLIIAIPLLFR
ncbi:MAG: hypothetical protein KKD28_00525 [Chloroflexi bacterium]|nr:hypothetical protein [Chloroflexota bacterium]